MPLTRFSWSCLRWPQSIVFTLGSPTSGSSQASDTLSSSPTDVNTIKRLLIRTPRLLAFSEFNSESRVSKRCWLWDNCSSFRSTCLTFVWNEDGLHKRIHVCGIISTVVVLFIPVSVTDCMMSFLKSANMLLIMDLFPCLGIQSIYN